MGTLPDMQIRIIIILVSLCGFGILSITTPISIYIHGVFAQIMPPAPSSPSGNETLPSIEITSPQDGQQVPIGELTIEGTSSDDAEGNCQVYADVNDMTPMQNATASGRAGVNDYSNWTFTYTPEYQVITEGVNELTAKISCFDAAGLAPISKFSSVNITGLPSPDTFAAPVPMPSMTE